MDIHELAKSARLRERTVRHYFSEGLLTRPVHRGAKTDYNDEHLLRLQAIRVLRTERGLAIGQVRAQMKKLGRAELEALVTPGAAIPVAKPAAPLKPYPEIAGRAAAKPGKEASSSTPLPQSSGGPTPSPTPIAGSEAWERIALLPGLELSVRGDASFAVRGLADEICAQYRARAEKR